MATVLLSVSTNTFYGIWWASVLGTLTGRLVHLRILSSRWPGQKVLFSLLPCNCWYLVAKCLVNRSYSSNVIQQSTFLRITALPVDKFSFVPEAETLDFCGYLWRQSIISLPLFDLLTLSLCLTALWDEPNVRLRCLTLTLIRYHKRCWLIQTAGRWFIPQRQFCLPKVAHLAPAFDVQLQLSELDFLPI